MGQGLFGSKMIKLEPREVPSPTHSAASAALQCAPSEPYPPWLAQTDKEIESILHGDMDATMLWSLPGMSTQNPGPSSNMVADPYATRSLGTSQPQQQPGAIRNLGQVKHRRAPHTITGVPTNMADHAVSPTMPGLSPNMPQMSPNMPQMSPNPPAISATVGGVPLQFSSVTELANYQLNSLVNMSNAQAQATQNFQYSTTPQQDQFGNLLPNLEELQASIFEEPQCSMSGLLLERAELSSGDLMALLTDRNNDSMKDLKL